MNPMIEVETVLSALAEDVPEGRLRAFACEYCKRVITLYPDEPILSALIAFGERRIVATPDRDESASLLKSSDTIYNSLYPGYGAPSWQALAFSAASEVAFTSSSVMAAINATEFVARAFATKAAETAPDGQYDKVFDAQYAVECAELMKALKVYFLR